MCPTGLIHSECSLYGVSTLLLHPQQSTEGCTTLCVAVAHNMPPLLLVVMCGSGVSRGPGQLMCWAMSAQAVWRTC